MNTRTFLEAFVVVLVYVENSNSYTSKSELMNLDNTVIVEVEPTISRQKRQFVSVTQFGQYPGFPIGWPFGAQHQIPQTQRPPLFSPTLQPLTTPKPTTTTVGNNSCHNSQNSIGKCSTMRQCYPVLYSIDEAHVESNTTNFESANTYSIRNPELEHILRSISGPCHKPEEISNQFLFKADAEFRRDLICCASDSSKLQIMNKPTTTTTTTTTPSSTSLLYPNRRPPPFIGHRPPSPTKAPTGDKKISSSTSAPVVPSSCGVSKIVGGTEAKPGKFPWLVALMNGQKQFCGGSLINSEYVLTAAHCVSHMGPTQVQRVRVLLGVHNLDQLSQGTVVKKVAKLIRHRFFSHQTLHNDVALLKLDSPVKFTNYISPICLARGQNRFASQQATVAGWGAVYENGGQPKTPREASIDIWTNDDCKRKYGYLAPGGITEHMMCAGSVHRDACRGDSGGPLMTKLGSYYEQIGIVSWGIGCGRYPGVYSRVTDFLGWITKNIQ